MVKRIQKRAIANLLAIALIVSSLSLDNALVVYGAETKVSQITGWVPVYANNEQNDYLQDQQTASGSVSQDIVGNATYSSTYMHFTDDEIAFRVRVSNIDGSNPYQFKNFVFIGIDADTNGSIDFFLGMYNPTGNNGRLGIYRSNPGYLNMSPSTTGISKPVAAFKPVADANYYLSQADSTFNGTTNYFLSFRFSMADIKAALAGTPFSGFNKSTPFRFITGTAAQDNSFNQDINGMDRSGWSAGSTWESLNIYSDFVSADGTANASYCTVRFDKNTGDTEATPSVTMATKGAALGSLPATKPTKRGMFFQEWNTQADGQGEAVTADTVINGNTTFYAIWSDKQVYTVTFNLNGGNWDGSTTSKTISTLGGVLGEDMPVDPTNGTNSFLGWTTSAGGTEYISAATIIASNLEVFAKWDNKSSYVYSFYDNIGTSGGELVGKVYTNNGGQTQTAEPTPVRLGYTFVSWNEKPDGSGRVYSLAKGEKKNNSFYAQWALAEYTLNFNGNGGSDTVTNVPGSQTISNGCFGTGYSEPQRTGYKFIEWNRVPEGTGEAMYPSSIVSATTTVYAIWEKETTVTFKANGGVDADQFIKAVDEKLGNFPQPPSKDNYTFLGWSKTDTNDANTIVDLVLESFETDVTLYAVWSPIYKVTFNGNSGDWGGAPVVETIPDIPTAYGSVLYFPDKPVRDGYEFTGWKDGIGGSFTMSTPITSNVTVYAQWQNAQGGLSTHTITATAGANGTITPSGATSVEEGSSKSYTFAPDTGYKVATIIIDKNTAGTKTLTSSEIAEAVANGYTFSNATANHTIDVTFALKTYDTTHTISNITYVGSDTVTHGTAYADTLTADTGYKLPDTIVVKVGGVTLTAGTDYTYNSTTGAISINAAKVTGAIEIVADAVLKEYGVTHTTTNMNYSGASKVTHGTAYADTLTADTGYKLPNTIVVKVGGVTLTAGTDYTYNSTTGAISINAAKVTGAIEIVADAVLNGYLVTHTISNITYDGSNAISHGTAYADTLTADTGYKLPNTIVVKVGGVTLTAGTDYTYNSTTGAVSIHAAKVTGAIEIVADAVLKEYGVTHTTTNMNYSGASKATHGTAYADTLTAQTGYKLPNTIVVKVGGVTLTAGTDYTYNSTTGAVSIYAAKVTGAIELIAAATLKTFSVSDQVEHGDFSGRTVTYGTQYDTTIVAENGYQLPKSIVITIDGKIITEGYTYDSKTGAVHIDGAKITGPVVILATDVKPIIYRVKHTITNGAYTGRNTAAFGVEYRSVITAQTGYRLPRLIKVKVGAVTLKQGTDYTYDSSNGKIAIKAGNISGDIEIIAAAVVKKFTVTDKVEHGSFAGDTATYGQDYSTTIVAAEKYELPSSITITIGGTVITKGYTYDSETGAVHIEGKKITGPVEIIAIAPPQSYSVTESISNGIYVGESAATPGADFNATITVLTGHSLPSAITVKVGGTTLKPDEDYTYDSTTGALTIFNENISGNIEIAAAAKPIEFSVEGSVNNSQIVAEPASYGVDYDTVIKSEGGKLPSSIVITVGGTVITEGYSYDEKTGTVHIEGKQVTGPVKVFASNLPKTGDATPISLWFILIALSGAGFVYTRKKNNCI